MEKGELHALFKESHEPRNASLESAWKSQPDLPAVIPDMTTKPVIGGWEAVKKLGEGEFATVFSCRRVRTGAEGEEEGENPLLALKAINKAKVQRHTNILKSKRNIRRVNMEVAAMRRCAHESICLLHDVLQSQSYVYLIMEMGERDLFTFLDGYADGCPDVVIKQVMRILALGLRHAHNAGISHRDIKPENILVVGEPHEWDEEGSERGIVKICDFGLCADIKDGKPLNPKTFRGKSFGPAIQPAKPLWTAASWISSGLWRARAARRAARPSRACSRRSAVATRRWRPTR